MSQRNQPIIEGIEGTVTIHSDVDVTTSAVLQNNWTATVAPAVTDDSGSGYAVGSEWIDVTADKSYKLVDASVGAAVWIETTGGGGAFLPLAGGTMVGDIEIGNNIITNGVNGISVSNAGFGQTDGTDVIGMNAGNGHFSWFKSGGVYDSKINVNTITDSRVWTMPDATGIVALVTDNPAPSLINTAVATTFVTPNETINCIGNVDFAVTLPSAVGIQGTTYTLVNSTSGIITLTPVSGQKINGDLTIDLVQWISRTVQSNNSDWIII